MEFYFILGFCIFWLLFIVVINIYTYNTAYKRGRKEGKDFEFYSLESKIKRLEEDLAFEKRLNGIWQNSFQIQAKKKKRKTVRMLIRDWLNKP